MLQLGGDSHMFASQSDPIWMLSISQQRQAELIADVRKDELAQAAREYAAARTAQTQRMEDRWMPESNPQSWSTTAPSKGWSRRTRQMRVLLASTAIGLGLGMIATLAYAAIPGTGGVISACVSTVGFNGQHILTLLDVSQRSACQQGQNLVTWNQTGPQGPKGDVGPQGTKGDTGAPGATHIIARSTTINAFRDGEPLEVSCNSGEVATGGGGHVSSDAMDQQLFNSGLTGGGSPGVITASEPIVTNGVVTGWRVKANRTLNATLVPLTAWVLCAS
jgi:hypothetical protein